jgi:DNA-binding NarL/FixJ family response regulator
VPSSHLPIRSASVAGRDRPEPIRVVVAEDQVLLREGIVRLLQEHGIEVAGVAGDAVDLLRKTGAHHPDVVITDVQMPPDHSDDGLRAAIRIRAEQPQIGVLVLSQFLDERYALDLIGDNEHGVGYLLKDRVGDVASFIGAVRRVAAGGSALDPEVVARMLGRRRIDDPLQSLTAREREVLALMAEGKSNAGIAETLHVSVAAVEKHATGIFAKLDIGHAPHEHRRVLAVLRLLQAS